MIFLLGVLVGGLLVSLPLVAIVLSVRFRGDGLEAATLAELQTRSIKRDTVRRMFQTVDFARDDRGFADRLHGRDGFRD